MEECILSKNVRFYTMAFENKNSTTVFDYPMKNFIDQIDSAMKNTKHFPFRETRSVNGKIMRIFRPVYLETSRIYVISFGKLMKDKPYMAVNGMPKEIPDDMFTVNTLAYNCYEKIALFTTSRDGPDYFDAACFLSTFIPDQLDYQVCLRPVLKHSGLPEVRNSKFVRNVIITLDLGGPINNIFLDKIQQASFSDKLLITSLNAMIHSAKEVGLADKLKIQLGVGQGKRNKSLDLASTIQLLSEMNLESKCISEIEVVYKNGEKEPIKNAKLIQEHIFLSQNFSTRRNQISQEDVINLAEKAFEAKRNEYYSIRNTYLEKANSTSLFEIYIDYHDDLG